MLQQMFIPSFFAELFPQYVSFYQASNPNQRLALAIHGLWRAGTSHLPPNRASFRIVKTGVEAMAGYGDFTFSTLRVEPEDTPAFEKWLEGNSANPLTVLEEFAGDGFKVSVTYVTDQNSFCVTVVGTKETKRHDKMGMSSWSDDLGEALSMAWYKHFVMCDGGEWPTKGHGKRWG
jgi:hypothetical protein